MSEADEPGALGEFAAGVAAGLDPQPQAGASRTGPAVTNIGSRWNHTTCSVCGQTFRREDAVRITEQDGIAAPAVTHRDPALRCDPDVGAPPAEQSGDDVADFAAGLAAAWRPLDGAPISRLSPRDWRIPRPGGRPGSDRRRRCLYCGHTFRAEEHVVVCPCSPHEPKCGAAVHRDPGAGLVCWEKWRPDGELAICPITLTRLDPR
ncbi:hypothetical protein [Cryptosporangium phraense]|uniref:Uncharacterized protein n=1 Tax=Cryptosporangium phraense TaxID=2593070 RepID=A0A545AZN4_9ACTN|nr:hypothetical protein [Cryptosporangium phraense]TQS46764.1 hypothetical protein FL583_00335 [Cryptosporangium phraense]